MYFGPWTLFGLWIHFCDYSILGKVTQFWLCFQEMMWFPCSSHILNTFWRLVTSMQCKSLATWPRELFCNEKAPRELLRLGQEEGSTQGIVGLVCKWQYLLSMFLEARREHRSAVGHPSPSNIRGLEPGGQNDCHRPETLPTWQGRHSETQDNLSCLITLSFTFCLFSPVPPPQLSLEVGSSFPKTSLYSSVGRRCQVCRTANVLFLLSLWNIWREWAGPSWPRASFKHPHFPSLFSGGTDLVTAAPLSPSLTFVAQLLCPVPLRALAHRTLQNTFWCCLFLSFSYRPFLTCT